MSPLTKTPYRKPGAGNAFSPTRYHVAPAIGSAKDVRAAGKPQRVILPRHKRTKPDETDPQEPRITGRYESLIEDPFTPPALAWLLFVNKAGSHLEGLLVEVRNGDGRHRSDVRISGELKPDGTFEIWATEGGARGHMSVVQGKLLLNISLLELPDLALFLPRENEKRPTFLDAAIFDLEDRFKDAPFQYKRLVKAEETRPLHTAQLRRLAAQIDLPKLDLIIERALSGRTEDETFFDRALRHLASRSGSVAQAEKTWGVDALEKHLSEVMQAKPGWNREDELLLQNALRLLLLQQKCTHGGVTKSYLQWVEDLVAESRTATGSVVPIPSLEKHLRIRQPKLGEAVRHYKLELSFDSPDKQFGSNPLIQEALKRLFDAARKKVKSGLPGTLDVDCALGTVDVELEQGRGVTGWRQSYSMVCVGCGFGKKIQATGAGKFKTSFSTAEEWTPRDFVGFFSILDAGAWLTVKPSDFLKLSPTYRSLGKQRPGKEIADGWRPRTKEEMDAEKKLKDDLDKKFDEIGKDLPLPKAGVRDSALTLWGNGTHLSIIVPIAAGEAIHSGLGAYFTSTFGYIRDRDDLSEKNFSRDVTTVGVSAKRRAMRQIDFDLDVAFPRPEGRARIREMCALELPWFGHRDSIIEITGNCDLIAGSAYNLPLSEHRAKNVLQIMKETLGADLMVPEDNIIVRGLGDQEARAHPGEALINKDRRRVDIKLNGRLVLTLLGAE